MLAVSVIAGLQGYGGEVRIYRAGPPVELPPEAAPTAGELRELVQTVGTAEWRVRATGAKPRRGRRTDSRYAVASVYRGCPRRTRTRP